MIGITEAQSISDELSKMTDKLLKEKMRELAMWKARHIDEMIMQNVPRFLKKQIEKRNFRMAKFLIKIYGYHLKEMESRDELGTTWHVSLWKRDKIITGVNLKSSIIIKE